MNKNILNKKLFIIIQLLFFIQLYSVGQSEKDYKYIQINGIITNQEKVPLPFVHVINLDRGNATITDENGIFSIVVRRDHKVLVSSLGYKNDTIFIPVGSKDYFYSKNIELQIDTIMLKTVEIYPWASYEEFKEAFRQLDLSNEKREYAQQNIKKIKASLEKQLSYNPDPGVYNKYVTLHDNIERNITKGTRPTITLLNPIAWAQFFEAVKNGMFRSDKKD